MERHFFSTNACTEPAVLSAWSQSLSRFAVAAAPARSATLQGEMITRTLPSGLEFTLMRATPQELVSDARGPSDYHWIALMLEGEGHYRQDDSTRSFNPGDFFFGKRAAKAALSIDTPFRMLLVNIPDRLLTRRIHVTLPRDVMHLSGRSGASRLVSNMLSGVADMIDEITEPEILPVEFALPQFLMSAIYGEGGATAVGGAAALRAGILHRICLYIDQRLDDPDLSVGQTADANNLSVRYLQKLFEEQGDTFAAYVRRRRLDQCRADLADPRNATVSITTICFRWGFSDAASFSRTFSEAFGLSPRAFRRQASERRQQHH